MCDKGFIWNLNFKNCMCRKNIIDKLVEERSENIDGNEMLYNETLNPIPLNAIPLNVYKKACSSCMIYMVLFVIFLIRNIFICCIFIYFHWYLKKITWLLVLVLDI